MTCFNTFTPARITGGSHLDAASDCAYYWWLTLECFIRWPVPPMARNDMPYQAARTTGGSHLYAPSNCAYHQWLALICPIRRPVPPIARNDMPHQAALTTGGSHLNASSGGTYHRWLALICPIMRRVPPVARTDISTRWRYKWFHPVAHSHCPVPRHHSYEDIRSHSVVKRVVRDFSGHPVYYMYVYVSN
ncbi:hypothetical protein AVEN_10646-1 [Araneus ventricosus]|uniref:Uncharacterized protein n=1 Tax=Araneus ventricosus TaxID=182803 RepID=A0A4Y2L6L5_ARAVE|nr:hypothetical protein AVEN_10646-1 [Araneus ventricosus]